MWIQKKGDLTQEDGEERYQADRKHLESNDTDQCRRLAGTQRDPGKTGLADYLAGLYGKLYEDL